MTSYSRLKQIGEGSFGKVHLVHDKSLNNKFVMKEINITKITAKEYNEARQEVAVLSTLRHANIVAYRESYEEKGVLFIIMQYCEGGDLFSKIERQDGVLFAEDQILDWFTQLCLAVKYIHERRILHRDIKSQNVFLTRNGSVKLGDFGISRVLDNTQDFAKTCIGTPYYLSPEICENKPYGYKSDVWSLGCVLYEMATLKHPFLANNIKNLLTKILRGTYPPISSTYSNEIKDLIHDLFQREPKNRPSASAILARQFIFLRCRKFMAETAFSEFEKSVTPLPKKLDPSKIVKRQSASSRASQSSPYIQSLQRSKPKARSTGSGKSSMSLLDPERIRKAAIRSKEAERKAIARRQKVIMLRSQRSTGTTTDSSSWISSSNEELTPRAFSSDHISGDDVFQRGFMPVSRERSLSLDSSLATPRHGHYESLDDDVGDYPVLSSEKLTNIRQRIETVENRFAISSLSPTSDEDSVGSAIPLGAPVTSSASSLRRKSPCAWRFDPLRINELMQLDLESTSSAMEKTSVQDVVVVHTKAVAVMDEMSRTRTIFPRSDSALEPTKTQNMVGHSREMSERSAGEHRLLENVRDTAGTSVVVHECSKEIFPRPNDGDVDAASTTKNVMEIRSQAIPEGNQLAFVKLDLSSPREKPVNVVIPSLVQVDVAKHESVTRSVMSPAVDILRHPAKLPEQSYLSRFMHKFGGGRVPDATIVADCGDPIVKIANPQNHGRDNSPREVQEAPDLDDASSSLAASGASINDTETLVGSDSDYSDDFLVTESISQFSMLEARRQELEELIGLEPLKKAYWILTESLERSESDDAGCLQQDVMQLVSGVLGLENQTHGPKVLALVLSDAMHFS